MSIKIIEQRLKTYDCANPLEEAQALKEIMQELILMSLSRQKFFSVAEFHGGTALRILCGLPRFSEDLDCALLRENKEFLLEPYLKGIAEELRAFGFSLEVKDRSKVGRAVKSAFLKERSIGKLLLLNNPAMNQVLNIKLEVDADPPEGAITEVRYLNFPVPFGITAKNLSSSFSGKLHALLCRKYTKGRDWYDFLWYVSHKVSVNMDLLHNALKQAGPWQAKDFLFNAQWLYSALEEKIKAIDWRAAASDVRPFVKNFDQEALGLWGETFFLQQLDAMRRT